MYSISNLFKKTKKPHSGGFGLIELMVSISILVIVMSIILSNNSAFNSAVLLRSQAYEIAFAVRESQLYAVSVTGDTAGFRNTYGLHFDTVTDNDIYKNFKDSNSDNFYNDASEEFGVQGVLDPRFQITEIEAYDDSGTGVITPANLSITFERPNFDALFYYETAGTIIAMDPTVVGVRIKVTLKGSTTPVHMIEVTRTGQISVI